MGVFVCAKETKLGPFFIYSFPSPCFLQGFIATVTDSDAQVDDLYEALEGLQELAEDIDHALGLLNLNALEPIVRLTAHQDAGVVWRALDVVAAAAQNNPRVQAHAPMRVAFARALRLMGEKGNDQVKMHSREPCFAYGRIFKRC